jgi:hypothetical protein
MAIVRGYLWFIHRVYGFLVRQYVRMETAPDTILVMMSAIALTILVSAIGEGDGIVENVAALDMIHTTIGVWFHS